MNSCLLEGRVSTPEWPYNKSTVAFSSAFAIAFLLSKFAGFSVGYALDDYLIVSQQHAGTFSNFFLSQGRYTNAALDILLDAANLQMANFSAGALAATVCFAALFYARIFSPRVGTRLVAWAAVGALLGAHSYYAEYVSFRQAALPMSIMFATCWMAATHYRKALTGSSSKFRHLSAALAFGAVAMGTNQLAISFLAIGVLYMHLEMGLARLEHASATQFRPMLQLLGSATLASAATGAVLITASTLLSIFLRAVFRVPANDRATLILAQDIPERAHQIWSLLPTLFYSTEPVASLFAKALCLSGLALLLISSASRDARRSLSAIVFLAISLCITLIPIAFSKDWWPVPRTLIAWPFALAATAALCIGPERKRTALAGLVLLLASAAVFCAHSSSMLLNQQRLNRWDMARAQEIAVQIALRHPGFQGRIAIGNPSWSYPLAPDISQGDMNVSAMSVPWAIDPLFDEATGNNLTVRIAADLAVQCSGKDAFPASDSITDLPDGEVLVCL